MCVLCGGPLLEDLCLTCVARIDDRINYTILAYIGTGYSGDDLQRMQFRRSVRAYLRAVAHARESALLRELRRRSTDTAEVHCE